MRTKSVMLIRNFKKIPKRHFAVILADPPWRFRTYGGDDTAVRRRGTKIEHYKTMTAKQIERMPIIDLAQENSVLLLWCTWPMLMQGIRTMHMWGFEYKTCAFNWMKAHGTQIDLFSDEIAASMKMGYWTRSSSEVCLLGTVGKPKRLHADVRQGIIAPAREHSRKPDGVHERIERLVAGPYLELFSRQDRPNWTIWGNEANKFKPAR